MSEADEIPERFQPYFYIFSQKSFAVVKLLFFLDMDLLFDHSRETFAGPTENCQ